nr:tyrosine-protein kinase JAK2 isoform X4 [Crassostrea gigas]
MSNMSKSQLINSDASANTNSANSHIELVPGGSAETGPDSVSSTHTQVTNLTSTTVNGPSTSSSSSSPREERLAPPITSADLDSQPVQNILSSVSVQSISGVCLQVELHDGTVYNVDWKDNPTVVEDLCIQLLKRYFPKMGPAAVQLFGLASIDKKQIPKMLWVNPCITIEELKRHILNSPTAGGKNTFFLRIRYVPGRKFLHNLPALGPEILKYLYLQCKDDFVKSRLSDIYEQDIKNEAKARGYAVLSIAIASKMEEKDCQDILNKQKLEAFLPSHLVMRLCRGYQLRKIMKTKTEEFLAQHSNSKVEELLMGYIKDVLNEVQSYGVERYEAKKVSGSLRPVHITLDVQQHEENGNTQYKGLFIDNEFFSSIDDFRSIHITPNHADQKKLSWNVHLDRSNGCPEVLRFDSKTVAESFVSGVNGYYRLITDYYMNLSQQMELPSLQEINRLKCHGPIDTSTAVRKLKTKYLSDEYYILKQSMQVFDQLAILFCYGGQTRKGLIDKKENMYCLEGENEEEFEDINCLIKYMAETRNLLPKHPIKVKPQQVFTEPVDVLRKLFVEEIIPDDDEEAATNNQRRKPYIILPEEIKIKELNVSLLNAEVDCMRTENAEMIGLEWIVAETEIKQILECRLVPESDLLSAGLDPNDLSHFKRCLDNLEEEMMKKQRYDVALSHCKGMKEVFEESNLEQLKSFLKLNDLDILKMVFFRKTVMASPTLVTEDPPGPSTIGYGADSHKCQPLRPMLSPTLPSVNAAFIPPAPFMPTPSRASLNTESLSNKATGVYNRSLPELPLDFKYIISSRRLQIQEKQLGSGHYGVVKEGMLFASQDDRSNPQKIAAKELKGDFLNVIDSEEFKEEAVLMSKLEHDNVVKFLGISDNMLILEYVEKGALNMYLRKFRKQNTYLPVWRLMKMISDVAQGMAYLASMRVIHCDLAGRNVLLTDKLVAKITDFGLAKILQKDEDYYTRSTGKELPLMWCSPESIANRKFTTKGDIWSYGILMWEVFTHAKPPVLCSNFSKEGFKKLEEGKRLKRPTHCPELVYQFMEKCWKFKPEERPDFNEACQSCREFAKIYPEPVVEQRVPVSLLNAEVDCMRTENAEMIGLEWIVAETEIKQILECRLVPESDLLSAGLDPNDLSHFKRCLDNLEEEMMKKQRYDVALSHCKGMKEVFEESNLEQLKSFLKLNDLDILKMVFFRKTVMASPTLVTEDPPGPSTIGYGADSHKNPELDVDKIIVPLLNAEVDCMRTENAEMIGQEWIVAETEIKQILECRLVPESDLLSAGLDFDNLDHFKRCLDTLEEEMMQKQRYDVALSRCQGMKEVFEESNLERLRSFLKLNDLDILKKVFYRSWLLPVN